MTPDRINEIECRLARIRSLVDGHWRLVLPTPLMKVVDHLQDDSRDLLVELRRTRAALDDGR